MQTVGSETLNSLRVALGQNQWLEEILGRFDEIALPDSWLVAAASRRQSGIWVADKPPSLASRTSTSYISINKTYRSKLKSLTKDASVIYFAVFQ